MQLHVLHGQLCATGWILGRDQMCCAPVTRPPSYARWCEDIIHPQTTPESSAGCHDEAPPACLACISNWENQILGDCIWEKAGSSEQGSKWLNKKKGQTCAGNWKYLETTAVLLSNTCTVDLVFLMKSFNFLCPSIKVAFCISLALSNQNKPNSLQIGDWIFYICSSEGTRIQWCDQCDPRNGPNQKQKTSWSNFYGQISRHTSAASRTCSLNGRFSLCSMRQAHRISGASFATRASSKIFKVCCVCCKEFSTDWARSWSFCTKCCEVLTFCSKEVWSSLYLGNLSTWHEWLVESFCNRIWISLNIWDYLTWSVLSTICFLLDSSLLMLANDSSTCSSHVCRDAIPKAHKWGSIQWEW